MSLKEWKSGGSNQTIRLGGEDEKGNANPLTVEGYYLSVRETTTKYGPALIHTFRTLSGDIDVWGKTNMNSKLAASVQKHGFGYKTVVTFTGKKEKTTNGSMILFYVATDENDFDPEFSSNTEVDDVPYAETVDEVPVARATKPSIAAPVADTAQQARTKAMLAARNN